MKHRSLLITVLVVLVGALFSPITACGATPRLSEATMANNVDETTHQPIDTSDTFTADTPMIYASVKLSNAPEDTEVSAEWIYVSGEVVDLEDYTIMTLSDKYGGTQYLYFSVSKPEAGWPVGNYKVVLFINGKEQTSIPFTVIHPAIPEKPENLLASDAEYEALWETFDSWGLDFHSLFTSYAQQGIAEDQAIMWLGNEADKSQRVYFKRVGDDWEPYDLSLIPPKPENLLTSDTEYQELWVTFDSWGRDFYDLFTSTSQQGIDNGSTRMWIGNAEQNQFVFFERVGDSWEPIYPPPKPENLLASDAEYQELWGNFYKWAMDFNNLFASYSEQGIAEGWNSMWIGSSADETHRAYFTRVGDSWEPTDAPAPESYQDINVVMPARDYTRVTATFTNTLEAGDVIEGFIEISGEYKTQDWSFDWTGEVLDPNGDTIDIFRGHWVKETHYDINVPITTAGEYTIRIRHNSRYEKNVVIHIRPEGWN